MVEAFYIEIHLGGTLICVEYGRQDRCLVCFAVLTCLFKFDH